MSRSVVATIAVLAVVAGLACLIGGVHLLWGPAAALLTGAAPLLVVGAVLIRGLIKHG